MIWRNTIMKRRQFTMVEILTVITIIAILAAILIGGVKYASGRAAVAKTIAIMTEFEDALEAYKKDYGVYPVCKDAKEVNFSDAEWYKFINDTDDGRKANKRNKPYMEGAVGELLDAYGKPFFYQYPNSVASRNTNKFALWSRGDDERHGKSNNVADAGEDGSDDICSWKSN